MQSLKALRLVKEAEVIALPGQVPEDTVAFKIVEGAYPELGKKELLAVPLPMTKDLEELKEAITIQEQIKSRLSWTRVKTWYFSHWEILPCIPHISIYITDLWIRDMRHGDRLWHHILLCS